MTKKQKYRMAFEKAVVLLKAQQKRSLSEQESQQLNEHVAFCKRFEMEGL